MSQKNTPSLPPSSILLLAAPTWLWGRCGRHNSPPASSVMDFIFCCPDSSHVSVDTVHPSLLRPFSFSSPSWYHLQSLSSDVFFTCPNHLSLAFLHLSVIFSTFSLSLMSSFLTWSLSVWPHVHLHIRTSSFLSFPVSSCGS